MGSVQNKGSMGKGRGLGSNFYRGETTFVADRPWAQRGLGGSFWLFGPHLSWNTLTHTRARTREAGWRGTEREGPREREAERT